MPSRPLQLTLAVRKYWVDEAGGPSSSFTTLFDLVGFRTVCEPNWPHILESLGPEFPDCGDLVKSVTSTVTAWCDALATLLESDGDGVPSAGDAWTQALIDNVESGPPPHKLNLLIEVVNSTSPFTAWDSARHGFVIALPNSRNNAPAPQTIFRKRLLLAFGPDKAPSQIESFGTSKGKKSSRNAGSSRMGQEVSDLPPAYITSINTGLGDIPQIMPDANTLAPPDELFMQPPYTLLMTCIISGPAKETKIHCSHSPTLEFLHTYLKKWGQQLSDKKRSLPEMKLLQTSLSTDTKYDRLIIPAEGFLGTTTAMSPISLMGLIEGVLGYELVFRCVDMGYHVSQYRRMKPFQNM